jgi:hypothetical protein
MGSCRLSTQRRIVRSGPEDQVTDTEKEIQRLAQKMKEGVDPINMNEYIEEDVELGTNEDVPDANLTASATSPNATEKAS